jgi:large subunit ribosomal protein L25
MSEVKLKAVVGREGGSRATRRLLAENMVPGVVYGLGQDPVAVAVNRRELRIALTGESGLNALLDLDVDGHVELTVVKDLQRHPVRREVTHIDFLRVDRDATIDVDVPIHVEGEATLVHQADGIAELRLTSITVNTKPADIPDAITVDISDMTMEKTITVADLDIPAGVTVVTPADQVVVSAELTRAAMVVTEPAEGEAAEGEEGEAEAEASSGDSDSSEG